MKIKKVKEEKIEIWKIQFQVFDKTADFNKKKQFISH